ncbi:DUF5333 domain-containing protein [Wenxinia saemankumensis]|uniref:Uncharacterized protein n=1 Tax=Wenxinia saemankumensis TaxID=1447782 RepID=A0A1M6HE25_9RHOB|nr:DUF5333 domain-containing protein [Wenxinia saemankumensis]SHJ20478.1 hypothetical protein SAMN05444417_3185 [Wenxinia saemankumensis]
MSFRIALRALAFLSIPALFAASTAARSELRNERSITEGLIATAIAYEIGDKCDDLSARMVRGVQYLWALKAEAERLGYTEEQIQAFMDNDTEKDRLEAIARQRLRDLGGVEGDWATYCAVGREQIAADTPIGRLLR